MPNGNLWLTILCRTNFKWKEAAQQVVVAHASSLFQDVKSIHSENAEENGKMINEYICASLEKRPP